MMKNDLTTKFTNGKPRRKIEGRVYTITKKVFFIYFHTMLEYLLILDPHSFMSTRLVTLIDITPEPLEYDLVISTLLGKTMIVELIYKSCVVRIGEVELLADLILLNLHDYDVILGMDWLATHKAKVDCYSKEVTISILNQFEVVIKKYGIS